MQVKKKHIGKEAEPYWADGVALLGGILWTYTEMMLLNPNTLEQHRLSVFLVRRLRRYHGKIDSLR